MTVSTATAPNGGGVPGYVWSHRSGTLPPGLQVTTRGALAGVPSARGTFTFTVGVTDSRGTTANATYTVTVS